MKTVSRAPHSGLNIYGRACVNERSSGKLAGLVSIYFPT